MTWSEVRRGVRADAAAFLRSDQRLWRAASNRGVQALACYRVARFLWLRHVPAVPFVLARLVQTFLAIDLSIKAELAPGISIVHGFGLVVGSEARVESGVTMYHGVTLGDRGSEWVGSAITDGHPVIESDVIIGAGAKVLGPITVGAGAVVGANAVVVRDVPPRAVVAGIPGRVVGERR